jgi:hypothetical protein
VLATTVDELSVLVKYDTRRFSTASIKQMMGNLETILITLATQPHITLGKVEEILDEQEKQKQLLKDREYVNAVQHKMEKSKRKAINI